MTTTTSSTSTMTTSSSHQKRKRETSKTLFSKKPKNEAKSRKSNETKTKSVNDDKHSDTSRCCRDIARGHAKYVFQVNDIKAIHSSGMRGLDTLICLYGGEDTFIDATPYVPIIREPWHGFLHVVHCAWQNRRTLVLEPSTFIMAIIQGLVMKRSMSSKTTLAAKNMSKSTDTCETEMDFENPEMIQENTTSLAALLSKLCHTSILPLTEEEGKLVSLHNYHSKCMVRRKRETHVDYPISLLETSLDTERSRTRPGFGRIILKGSKSEWLAMFVTVGDLLKEMPWWKKYVMPILAHIVKVRMGTDQIVVDGSKTFQDASLGHYENTRTFWNQMYFIKVHGRDLQVHGWINALFPFTIPPDGIHSEIKRNCSVSETETDAEDQDLDVFEWTNSDDLPWVRQEIRLESEQDLDVKNTTVVQDKKMDDKKEDTTAIKTSDRAINKLNRILAQIPGRSPLAFPSGLVHSNSGLVFGFEGVSERRLLQSNKTSSFSLATSFGIQRGLMLDMDTSKTSASHKAREVDDSVTTPDSLVDTKLGSVLFWTRIAQVAII